MIDTALMEWQLAEFGDDFTIPSTTLLFRSRLTVENCEISWCRVYKYPRNSIFRLLERKRFQFQVVGFGADIEKYLVCKSPNIVGLYPKQKDKGHRQALALIIAELTLDGWRLEKDNRSWYQFRFIREY